jgi:UDP-N-acetylglucosamine 3-dehydrogenase
MPNLRAGMIGLGMMGRHHTRVLSSLEGVELVAVADPAGDPHGVSDGREVLGSIEELISKNIDYCVVAVPTSFHEQVGLALADAGIHALIEKPIAPDVASALRIVEAFEKADLIGAVGHIERYNPALQEARRRIENGDLGRVFQIATRRQGAFPARIADVGVVKDLATHDIDLTAWVAQQPFTWVQARTANRSGRIHEDLVSAVGQLADGTVTNHLVNWLSPFKQRETTITGERGAYVCDTLTADITFYANGSAENVAWEEVANFRGVSEGDVVRYAIAKPEPLRVEHEAFRDAVLGKNTDIVTLRQGLETVRIAELMLSTAESK